MPLRSVVVVVVVAEPKRRKERTGPIGTGAGAHPCILVEIIFEACQPGALLPRKVNSTLWLACPNCSLADGGWEQETQIFQPIGWELFPQVLGGVVPDLQDLTSGYRCFCTWLRCFLHHENVRMVDGHQVSRSPQLRKSRERQTAVLCRGSLK